MSNIDTNNCKFKDKFYGTCEATRDKDGESELACFDCKDCYYRQLQQLKAELQAYKDKVKPVNFVDSDEYLKVVVENKQLKAENEELKERLKCNCFDSKSKQDRCTSYKRMAEDYERDLKDLKQLKAENESYKYQLEKRVEICDSWFDVANKYKKVLDEIEEYLNQYAMLGKLNIKYLLQLINQAKEGE